MNNLPSELRVFWPYSRSSDGPSCMTNPFGYFLSRRLGIAASFSDSAPMNRGTYFHIHCANAALAEDDRVNIAFTSYDERVLQLKQRCEKLGAASGPILERERDDYNTASAWFGAIADVPLFHEHTGFRGSVIDYLTQPGYALLGTEITICIEGTPPAVAQCDALILDEKTKSIWIVDFKTTSMPTKRRLATCAFEYQTLHYSTVVRDALRTTRLLHRRFGLQSGTTFGGMTHIAVQTPTIKFGTLDRDCTEREHTLKSGPRKGEIEIRREYEGDPRLENYLTRCRHWYLGTGPHIDRESEVAANPPVNISETPAVAIFDPRRRAEYNAVRRRVQFFATATPVLSRFPPNAHSLLYGNARMEPFYQLDPAYWPSIIETEGFNIVDRDEHVPDPPSLTILGVHHAH